MRSKKTVNEWKEIVQPAISSKTSEFIQMGYLKIVEEDVWNCLKKRVWKGNPKKLIHEVIQDIMHLNTYVYMSHLTLESYKNDDLMISIAELTRN